MARRGFCVADGGQKNQAAGCTEYNRKHRMDSRRKNVATSRGRCPCVRNENRNGRRRGAAATLSAVIHHSPLRLTCTLELCRESADAHQWYRHGWMPPFRGRSNTTHLYQTTLVTVALCLMACRNWQGNQKHRWRNEKTKGGGNEKDDAGRCGSVSNKNRKGREGEAGGTPRDSICPTPRCGKHAPRSSARVPSTKNGDTVLDRRRAVEGPTPPPRSPARQEDAGSTWISHI